MIRTKQHGVTNARTAWNRVDVLIQPMDGEGQVWVSAASVRGVSPQGCDVMELVL